MQQVEAEGGGLMPEEETKGRRFVVHVCPVPSCRVIHVHGLDGDLELQRTPAWCYGSDAPGYPDGHGPAEFKRVEVEAVGS